MLSYANAEQIEIHLERLCKHLQNGYFPSADQPYQRILKGLLFHESKRVRRWTLNTIALLGKNRARDYEESVQQAVLLNRDEPLLLSAAVAALFSVSNNDVVVTTFLSKHLIPVEGALLISASQHSVTMASELSRKKINIDSAEPLELQNAALLIGLKKAEGIFHSHFPDRTIIGQLNTHPDDLVSQYSIWAIAENDNFCVDNLGIDIRDIESKKIKQRKWMLLTVVKDIISAEKYREILCIGANDPCPEVRESLASGIKNIFYPEMEDMTLRWLSREEKPEATQALLVHMCAQADESKLYKDTALEHYRRYKPDSLERLHMQAACEKLPLYKEFRKINYLDEGHDLFENERVSIMNNTQNFAFFGGTNNVSGVTNSGNFQDTAIKNVQKISNPEFKEALTATISAVTAASIAETDKQEILEQISRVADNPKPDCVKTLIEMLQKITVLGQFAVSIAKLFGIPL